MTKLIIRSMFYNCKSKFYLCCFLLSCFLKEIPNGPVTVFQDGRVKIELNFNAETSNVLIVNARALGEEHLDVTVMFDMQDVSMMSCRVRQKRFMSF